MRSLSVQFIIFILCFVFMGSIAFFNELSLKSLAIVSLFVVPMILISYFSNKGHDKLSENGKAIMFGLKKSLKGLVYVFYGYLLLYFWSNQEEHNRLYIFVAMVIVINLVDRFKEAYKHYKTL